MVPPGLPRYGGKIWRCISKAEKEFVGTKLGEARLAVVVSWLREKVPAPIRFLVTDDLIRKAVQTSFNAAKSGLEVLKNA